MLLQLFLQSEVVLMWCFVNIAIVINITIFVDTINIFFVCIAVFLVLLLLDIESFLTIALISNAKIMWSSLVSDTLLDAANSNLSFTICFDILNNLEILMRAGRNWNKSDKEMEMTIAVDAFKILTTFIERVQRPSPKLNWKVDFYTKSSLLLVDSCHVVTCFIQCTLSCYMPLNFNIHNALLGGRVVIFFQYYFVHL